MTLLLSAEFFLFFFFNKKKLFRYTIRVSNGLDPDQDPHFVGRAVFPHCLQRLSTHNKSGY